MWYCGHCLYSPEMSVKFDSHCLACHRPKDAYATIEPPHAPREKPKEKSKEKSKKKESRMKSGRDCCQSTNAVKG